MKIGIDARFFGPKSKGLGRYTQKLIENLEKIDLENEYVIFLRSENWNEYQPKAQNFKKYLADWRWYSFGEQIFMPFALWRSKLDLVHFPHFNAPLFYFGRFVVTIHDLILRRFPTRRGSTLGFFKYWLKYFAYRAVIFFAIKKSEKIIAVSEYTKNDILKFYKIKPNKIEVIYEGAPPIASSQWPIANSKTAEKEKFYLLYVGNAYPHKNLEKLIEAFGILKKQHQGLRLLLVGEEDYFYRCLKSYISSILESMEEMYDVVFCGFVGDEELRGLYQNAAVYVFPSLCEGFGLPPLEAMASGAPVICSDSTCLPEILGDAAIYFDAQNAEDMAEKISSVLGNENLRGKLIARGLEIVGKYSWKKMAEETLKVYQSD